MKKLVILAAVCLATVGLTACGISVGDIDMEAGVSAIYIQEDGAVSYAVSEKFDKDYYDEEDLESKIDAEVKSYNEKGAASVNDAITVDEFDVSDDSATVVLNIATEYDFLNYMKTYNNIPSDSFYIGSISNNGDCQIKGTFVSPDKKETVKGKDIKKMSDNILIVNDRYKVQVDGTILYMSENCSIDEDNIVTTAKTDDGISYIVYKVEE